MGDADSIKEQLSALAAELKNFVAQYENDMRGDKKLDNGSSGLIGEVRKLKDIQQKYPSTSYLLATKPLQTIAVLLGLFVLANAILSAPTVLAALERLISGL